MEVTDEVCKSQGALSLFAALSASMFLSMGQSRRDILGLRIAGPGTHSFALLGLLVEAACCDRTRSLAVTAVGNRVSSQPESLTGGFFRCDSVFIRGLCS